MKTSAYVVLQMQEDHYNDCYDMYAKFPDADGSFIWNLTAEEAKEMRMAFNDYDSPLRDQDYALVQLIQPNSESRDTIKNALVEIRAREDRRKAEEARVEAQRLAAAEKRRIAAAEKKLKKETETKEQLYLRLKAEFESGGTSV